MKSHNGTRVGPGAAWLGAVALVAASCGAPSAVTPTTGAPPTSPPDAVRVPVTTGQEPVTAVPDLVERLADDLAVPTDDVAIVTDETVTWPDGSLGCPEPEMAYTQAVEPGRRVILESDGVSFTYHSSLEGGFFLCTKPQPPASITPPTSEVPVAPTEIRSTADAVDALAARLGVARDAVTVVVEENVTWSDGSIGCPQEGRAYTQALVDGRRVVLAVGGVQYHYHGAMNGPLAYCANPTAPSQGGIGDS